ncbi:MULTISPECIES: hypothetical protein [Weeksellaceae]|uniref:hypothetical protein n=1 Tax=Weeksellaceae TaxID=2762318 RepID=UPI001AE00B41|nr:MULTISPECIES: hypothetical protein [Weeksellaceae]MDE5518719.1 hypothetical protein [Elizabethkingia meningoseptica]
MIEESDVIKFRIKKERKIAWKKQCSQKQISLTNLIINSVENRMMDDERKKVLAFIEKQDNLFAKIENNINQVAKIANGQKFIGGKELILFEEQMKTVIELKKQQNEIFIKIYSLIAHDH